MPQFTNLNTPPYNDDFDENKNFHKILFRAGASIQSRELNQFQSILQNQIERFSNYSFAQGTQIIPGEINLTTNLNYVKISLVSNLSFIDANDEEVQIDFDVNELKGKEIKGRNSGIVATIVDVKEATENTSLVIFVHYENSGFSRIERQFRQGEILSVVGEESTIPELTVATDIFGLPTTIVVDNQTIANPPLGLCSAIKIEEGIYYINGTFVRNDEQLLIINEYYSRPSAKIGFLVEEEKITEKQDQSLYDNSRGSNNFRAPGAHRLKINLKLASYEDESNIPNNFIEIATIKNGQLENKSIEIQDNSSKTFENYIIEPFFANINNQQLEISQGAASIDGKIVRNEKIRRFPIKRAIETFSTKNKTINAENLPSFQINNVVGSPPLSGDNPELTAYPNVLLYSIPDFTGSFETARKTILIRLRDRDIWDPGDELWYRVTRNEVLDPKSVKIISYRRIDVSNGLIEITVEGDSEDIESAFINYDTNESTLERILFPTFDQARDTNNFDRFYGTIEYYTSPIFPVIGRVKPIDIKLEKKSNLFNPNIDNTISQKDSVFSFNYFDPQYFTKITLQNPIENVANAFNASIGSYIFDIDNEAYGTIEKNINNKILIVKTVYGKFTSGKAIRDSRNRITNIAKDFTISHLIIRRPREVTNLRLYINDIEIASNNYTTLYSGTFLYSIDIISHNTVYDTTPIIKIRDGNSLDFVDIEVDAILHTNSVMEYNRNDAKSLNCTYGASRNVFSGNILLNNKKLLSGFSENSRLSDYSLSTINEISTTIPENSYIEYLNSKGIKKSALVQGNTNEEIFLNKRIDGEIISANISILTPTNRKNINSLVYPTGSKRTKQIYNTTPTSKISYYYKKDFITVALPQSNNITFEAKLPFGNQRFAPFSEENYLLTVLDPGETKFNKGDILFLNPNNISISTEENNNLTSGAFRLSLNRSLFSTSDTNTVPPILKLTATVITSDSKPKVKTYIPNKRIVVTNYGDPVIPLIGTDYDSNEPIIISYSDIVKINYIHQGTASKPPQVNVNGELNTGTGEDITHKYIIDLGQRDTFYDVGRIILAPNETPAEGQLVIGFDYFDHSSESFSTVDSYIHDSGIDEELIPTINSGSYGDINLANVIDFRPKVDFKTTIPGFGNSTLLNSSSFDNDGGITSVAPVGTSSLIPFTIEFDEKQYLDRIDALYYTKEGTFLYKTGNSSLNPSKPNVIKGSILLYYIYVPAYTKNYEDIKIISPNNNRYKMTDIGNLEKRIERLEYYTSNSILEQQAQNMQIKDEFGLERYKTGFIIDNFEEHKIGNISSKEYNCSINPQESTLNPEVYETSIKLEELNVPEKNYKISNGIVTLPYNDATLIENLFSSSTINPNPFLADEFEGTGKLVPNIEPWFDERKPPLLKNDNTKLYSITQTKDKGISSIHNSYLINWLGVNVPITSNIIAPLNSSVDELNNQEENALVSSSSNISPQNNILGKGVTSININNRLLNNSIQFYASKQKIEFTITMLKPNTEHYIFLEGVDIRRWVNVDSNYTGIAGNSLTFFNNRIFSDDAGQISGIIVFPNGSPPVENEVWSGDLSNLNYSDDPEQYFLSGSKKFVFTSDEENGESPESFAELYYYVIGAFESNTPDISSLKPIEKKELQTTSITNGKIKKSPNPLCQIFNIQNYGVGVCLTKVDLFFKEKARNLPIKIFLASVVDNIPTSEIIPGSIVVKNPNTKIKVNSNGRTTVIIGELITGSSSGASGRLIGVSDRNNRRIVPNFKNEISIEQNQTYSFIIDTTNENSYQPVEELDISNVKFINAANGTNTLIKVDLDRGNLSSIRIKNPGENYESISVNIEPPSSIDGTVAVIRSYIDKGRIYNAEIIEPGRGYSAPPAISIVGTGLGAGGGEIETEIKINSPSVEMGIAVNDINEPATSFYFDNPIYLQNNKSYALIIQTESNEYKLISSKINENDSITGNIITNNPSLGSLYKSQNIQNWKEELSENIKLKLYNAEFDISKNSEIILKNSKLEEELLELDPFETDSNAPTSANSNLFRGNNTIVKVTHKNHGLEDSGNSFVYFKGAKSTSGISANSLNQSYFEVDNVGIDNYTIQMIESTSSNNFGGGDSVYASTNKKYETIYPHLNTLEVDETNIDISIKTTNIIPIDNNTAKRNYSSYSQSDYEQTFLNEVHYFSNQKVITSSINNIFNDIKDASLFYKLTLSSNNKLVSPMIDLSNATAKIQTNKIEYSFGKEDRHGIRNQIITLFPVYRIDVSYWDENTPTTIQGATTGAKGSVVGVSPQNPTTVYVKVSSENNFESGENLNVVDGSGDTIVIASVPIKVSPEIEPFSTITARNKNNLDVVYAGNISGKVIYNKKETNSLIAAQYNKSSNASRLNSNENQEKDIFRKNDLITYNGQLEWQFKFWEIKSIKDENGVDYKAPTSTNSDISSYVTKEINLKESANNLDVRLTANIKNKNQVLVLYKLKKEYSQENLNSIKWQSFEDDNVLKVNFLNSSNFNESKESYQELSYSANNLDNFTSFAIKIILKSDNPTEIPKIQDLRAVASI